MRKKKMLSEGNQIHNFISSSGSGTVINYGSGSGFLTSYGSGSTRQKVTVPTVPVPAFHNTGFLGPKWHSPIHLIPSQGPKNSRLPGPNHLPLALVMDMHAQNIMHGAVYS